VADWRPRRIRLPYALRLCFHGAFNRARLSREEEKDERIRASFPKPVPKERPRAFKIRRALWSSFLAVVFPCASDLDNFRLYNCY
jgi:hypothetical protein